MYFADTFQTNPDLPTMSRVFIGDLFGSVLHPQNTPLLAIQQSSTEKNHSCNGNRDNAEMTNQPPLVDFQR